MDREKYMALALEQAEKADGSKDIPVGCIIVKGGEVIGCGYNRREADHDATAHAEMQAIREACAKLGQWRLEDCQMYVTLEPCPMCAGAIINSRIDTLVYGAREDKSGACGSVINLFMENFNHKPKIYGGVMEAQCKDVLQIFFKKMREKD